MTKDDLFMTDSNPLILVVDDNEMNRDMLSRRLRRMGYASHLAENGEEALAMIAETTYNLLLLDIMMPTLSGYEVLERIKQDDATRSLPVIMISAVDDLDSVVRCIELGAEDYLFKPFNPVLLKARIHASLKRSGRGLNPAALQPHIEALRDDLDALLDDDADNEHLQRMKTHLNDLQNLL
jgi:DNA-binding response OmpR family regulator